MSERSDQANTGDNRHSTRKRARMWLDGRHAADRRHDSAHDVEHLLERIQDLENANGQLTVSLHQALEAAAEARRDGKRRADLMASVSHEIRTPLNAILGYVELLADSSIDETLDAPNPRSHLATVTRNAEYLLHLVNDVLDFSKLDADALEVERTVCRPAEIASEVRELLQPRAEAARLRLEFLCDGSIPQQINSDPLRLRQILVNLVNNAIKFTPSGAVTVVARYHPASLVDADAKRHDARLEFEVRDTGIGMTPEQLSQMFQPFHQATVETSRRFGGTGLGLAISKQLVELLGGEIFVESQPGRGSTFRFDIQTGPVLPEAAMMTSLITPLPLNTRARRGEPPPLPQLRGRVLLAEDAPDNQRLVEFILRKSGVDVTVVDNGQQAKQAAVQASKAAAPFDLILMDMQMPVLDGFEATRQLRSLGYKGPIVALTAHTLSSHRSRCIEAGCDDYATKPIDRQKLIGIVQRYVASRDTSSASPD